jgi:amino acid adenylation domain-containing protein
LIESLKESASLTLIDFVRLRALEQADRLAYTFLLDGESAAAQLSYGELDQQARAIGGQLQGMGLANSRVLLLCPTGLPYIAAFFGCLYAGAIAVPAYPPSPSQLKRTLPRLEAIAASAQPAAVIAPSSLINAAQELIAQAPSLRNLTWIASDVANASAAAAWTTPELSADSLAFLQYTSGSTSAPKGVMVSHGNLLHNLQQIYRKFRHSADSRGVIWLPPYHDMGLIGGILQPLYGGFPVVLMSPVAFLQQPARWLQAISHYGATTSGGPNFAYDLCVRKITPEQRQQLDLSSWQVAFNGAEPVRADVIARFTEAFAPCGFRPEAWYPTYGLAEATLMVSGADLPAPPLVRSFDSSALQERKVALAEGSADARLLVGCGQALKDQQIAIVDPDRLLRCAPDQIGEIWVAGPSIAQGYWGQPETSARSFAATIAGQPGRFLRTGDLGFLHEGELFITGRLKDLIIIRGRNHYPQDIERTVEQSYPGLRAGAGAAFSIEVGGEERVVVVQELERQQRKQPIEPVIAAIRGAVAEEHELQLHGIALLRPGAIPKTSSGKIQRHLCREGFAAGTLAEIGRWIADEETIIEAGEVDPQALRALEPGERQPQLERYLRRRIAPAAGIAAAVLDPHAPVSTLGLDSLAAIELQYGIEQDLGVAIPMARLLSDLSIAELAAQIVEQMNTRMPAAAASNSDQARPSELPLSHGQRALWLLDQLAPGNNAYTIARAARLIGADLDLAALHKAFQLLVDRHPALRTTFVELAGEPRQRIHQQMDVAFQVEDATAWSDAALGERLKQEAAQPFDLQHGPLLRVLVFKRSAEQHVLLLLIHHLIADLQSLAVLLQELGAAYTELCQENKIALPEQTLDYGAYIARQNALLAGPAGERLWAYWQRQLAGELPTLNLPLDRPRPALQSYRGATETIVLDAALVDGLKATGQQQRTTLFMTLLAAFGVLLHRYTGQDNLLLGTPTTGRSQADLTRLVGYFVNPVPLRLDLAGTPAFDQLLRRTRQVVLDAFEHQDYPFDLLVSRLRPNRDLGRAALIQAMFVMQHTQLADAQGLAPFALEIPGSRIALGGVAVEPLALEQQTAQFDLTLTVAELPDGLGVSFNYNNDLFDAATIQRMASHFATLLARIAAQPTQTIDTLPLLNADEERQVLAQWSDQPASYAAACLHRIFEQQAARTPEAIALVAGEERLSYAELNRQANRLAHQLQQRGVGPDTLVGLCMERSPELIVAILAILKAGAAYLPIDPIYPHERLRLMLDDAQAPALIIQEHLLERAAAYAGEIICWERDAATIARQPDHNPESAATPDHLAYVIYTSGSTGTPKGSLITHANVARLFAATEPWFKFGSQDVWTLFHSYAFDFSVWEIWGALLHGGRLVIVPQNVSRSPDLFYRLISSAGVTVLNQTPSAFRQLMEVEERHDAADLAALRLVIFGGEALELPSLRPWLARHGDQQPRLVNMYGITETTVHVTYRPISAAEVAQGIGSVIGGPIPDLRLYLLDRRMQPVPPGVPGELYVGGAGLARGYLGRPELTAERFVPDPFSNDSGARLYKTGDLARSRADGDIEYLGRIDQQVKIRGFRIELGEIEAVLRQHPAVRDLAVLAAEVVVERNDADLPVAIDEQATPVLNELRPFIKSAQRQAPSTSTEQRLIAYLVAADDAPPTVSELRRWMSDKLPAYMIPAVFVFLPSLPITEHGKLDRKALPQIDGSRPLLESAFVAPGDAVEQDLAEIWRRVLGIAQVGIHDNFFELGGDSILGIQVRAQAEARGLHFSLQQLFQHQTIAELARVLTVTAPGADSPPATAPFSLLREEDRRRLPAGIEDAYPLARMQAGVIFHCQLEPHTPLYHDIFMYRIKVRFDEPLFRQAVQELIDRHAVLRTSFHLTDYSEPLQLVHASVAAPFFVEDLRGMSEQEQRRFQEAWVEEEKQRRFAWESAPLIRFYVHRISEDVCDLVLSFHDTIFDGWSTASLLTELMLRYDAQLNGSPRPTEPPLVKYRDFVAQEQRIVASEAAQQFWRATLRDAVVTPLPRWPQPRDAEQAAQVAVLDVPIAAGLSDALKELARTAQVPLKHVLLAAHMKVMSLLAGQDEIISGLETNGRIETQDGEKTIGVHLNMVPFRLRLAPGNWIDLIRQVFAAELEVVPFRHYPLAELQRERRGQPWFETVFNYTHFHVFEELRELRSLEVIGGRGFGQTHFTLLAELNLNTFTGQIQVDLVGNLQALSREQLAAIGGYYASVLNAMVAQPAARHETSCLLAEAERSRQLLAWNDTRRDYPQDRCVQQLIEEQAARTPDAPAVIDGGTTLSYRELNRRANRLARQLQTLGVGVETRVAICLGRSAEMLVALLGVLKAGAAYVPLDPSYPAERIGFMLRDSRAAVIVAEASTVERLPAAGSAAICRIDQLPETDSVEYSAPAVAPDNLCYIIYTSGSTGQPKGVQISHRALVNCLASMQREPGLNSQDRLLAVTTLSFDIAGLELYLPLIAGATVVLASRAAASDADQLAALLAESRATLMQATPATWRLLLASGWRGQRGLKVLCGGEALPPELARQLLELGVELWNMYGPTETTIWSATGRIDRDDEPITVGRPIANTAIYILDRWLQPVPVGVVGDIYIGGDGLARGYFGQPALTAELFMPDPFSGGWRSGPGKSPGARLYAVGDRARYLPDGRIEILGRSDQQIKLRGFRIELGEIAAALTQHPDVREAAVIVREDPPGTQRLVAYVTEEPRNRWPAGRTREENASLASELRQFLKDRLPEYMLPSVYVVLDALPLTPNGKLDRSALPAPEGVDQETAAGYVAPRTPIEVELAQLWAQLFGAQQIGIHDDFFTLGGHSLLATQLIIHARNRFHVEIPIAMLFSTPTIAGMAAVIEQLQAAQESDDDLARMLDELDQLSDEDVRSRLLADF